MTRHGIADRRRLNLENSPDLNEDECNEDSVATICFYADEYIIVNKLVVGVISVMDSTPRQKFDSSDVMLLRHVSATVSKMLMLRRESFLKSTELMTDILHDVRTPLMALDMSSSILVQHSDDIFRVNANISGNSGLSRKVGRTLDGIVTSISYLNVSVEEYSLLQRAHLILKSPVEPKETDLVTVVQEAYNHIGSNFLLRRLIIHESDFANTLIYSCPDALSLLVSITLRKLLRSWRQICVTVQSTNVSPSASSSPFLLFASNHRDPSSTSADTDVEITHDATTMFIEIKFECQERVLAYEHSSYGKDSFLADAVGIVLQVLNGYVSVGSASFAYARSAVRYLHCYVIGVRALPVDSSSNNLLPAEETGEMDNSVPPLYEAEEVGELITVSRRASRMSFRFLSSGRITPNGVPSPTGSDATGEPALRPFSNRERRKGLGNRSRSMSLEELGHNHQVIQQTPHPTAPEEKAGTSPTLSRNMSAVAVHLDSNCPPDNSTYTRIARILSWSFAKLPRPLSRKPRVLIVEDSVPIQKVMRKWFEGHGHEVTVAGDGEEGLRLLKAREFEVVFTDFVMVSCYLWSSPPPVSHRGPHCFSPHYHIH